MSNFGQITSWSFSRYNTYTQCPLKAKLKFIDKLKEPGSPALRRGSDIHDACEAYIKGNLAVLPKEAKKFARMFRRLRRQFQKGSPEMSVEESWAFTKFWTKTTWDDWAGCWVRIKVDCAEIEGSTMIISDWKTGKFREGDNSAYTQQLELYALGGMMLNNRILKVVPRLVYLDEGIIYPNDTGALSYGREDIPQLQRNWEGRARPMLKDKAFRATPNRYCSWCHFRKSNSLSGGGQCQF